MNSPAYTPEDHALLMGLDAYERTLCVCGFPKAIAWHGDMDGYFETTAFVCHGCTAQAGGTQVVHRVVHDTRDHDAAPLTPLVVGETTTEPAPPPTRDGR